MVETLDTEFASWIPASHKASSKDRYIDKLNYEVGQARNSVNSAFEVMIQKLREHPPHALRKLPEFFEKARKKIDQIEAYHSRNISTISTLKVDIDQLKKIKLSFDVIKEQANDPKNDPVTFEYNTFFKSGEYEVKPFLRDSVMEDFVAKIDETFQQHSKTVPGETVKIVIAVTGHADDIEILPDSPLERSLCDSTSLSPCPPQVEAAKEMNKLLSQQRAKNIANYISDNVAATLSAGNYEIDLNPVGKGVEYPPYLKVNCDGNCPERRIAYVSKLAFPDFE